MAAYRYQVVSVGWWRGKIKRWNTTFNYAGTSSQTAALYSKMQAAGYPNPGDVTGDCSGGVASIAVYNPTGGTPISNTVYFDWQTPSEWIPYTGTAWSSITEGTPLDASGESAAVILGLMGALSSSGKPVFTRKYLHAIPSRTAVDYADPDISSTVQAALVALFTSAWMANPAGTQPSQITCDPWYLNHQRVRGRRRTATQVATESFSAGVVVGAGAAASDAGAPFQSGSGFGGSF